MDSSKPVVFIIGTTASGKSQWALDLAQRAKGVVVNCDSIQVYKSLNVGAAKPTPTEMSLAPHYLYDYIPEGETMTAGIYARDFFSCMETLPGGAPAFVVGGTGFYFQAIEKGMYPVQETPPSIQRQIAETLQIPEGAKALYEEFQRMDPEAAGKIHPQDHYRLGRAMELIRAEGKSLTQIQKEFSQKQKPFPYPLLKVGLRWEREALRKRVQERTEKMLQQGLVEEVRGLLARGFGEWSALHSVGYKEVLEYLREKHSEEWLLEAIVQNTMSLAKKQRTWFQRDPHIVWFEGGSGFEEAFSRIQQFLSPFLSSSLAPPRK